MRSAGGYSVLEVLFVTTLIVTVSGVTVPRLLAVADESRAAGAARYVSGRLQRARMEAILRSADVAIRFSATPSYGFATFVDGNGNGVLDAEEADLEEESDGLPNERLFIRATKFRRFAVTREIDDGLLAPRFAPSQRAWVLSGFFTRVDPTVDASIPRDADNR